MSRSDSCICAPGNPRCLFVLAKCPDEVVRRDAFAFALVEDALAGGEEKQARVFVIRSIGGCRPDLYKRATRQFCNPYELGNREQRLGDILAPIVELFGKVGAGMPKRIYVFSRPGL